MMYACLQNVKADGLTSATLDDIQVDLLSDGVDIFLKDVAQLSSEFPVDIIQQVSRQHNENNFINPRRPKLILMVGNCFKIDVNATYFLACLDESGKKNVNHFPDLDYGHFLKRPF
jgi:hypothetical protein